MTYTERMKRIRQQRAYTARCAIHGLPAILAPYVVTDPAADTAARIKPASTNA